MTQGKNLLSVLAATLLVVTLSTPFAAEAAKNKKGKAKAHHSQVHKKGGKHAKAGKKKKHVAKAAPTETAPTTAAPASNNVEVVEPPAM
ncbi:hypothetical protein [Bdellovibrio sp. HCB274]|uniref:hypothetical protein n=1 Tax=Bdellovibrio sp. HCB274 TaxID=3394361 RepID=UPI0039B55B6D